MSQVRILPGALRVLAVQRAFPVRPIISQSDSWSVPGRWANDTKWRSLVPDGPSRGGIKAYRYVVKVGREEPCIVIKRRRSPLMAQ